ncbi:MAG: tripartite tricarboxylate transporter TctB family protein [Alphaproteobacteria bacterium]|nr:MAG: tripartite tricarboxylate transporter TctB family protein [Alphaproteobacteria bacterium]
MLALLSVYFMWKSAELPIGWIPDKGPAGGAFPFWLSAGMLVCSVWIFIRGYRGVTPEGRSREPFMDRATLRIFLSTTGSLLGTLLIVTWLGFYVAIPALLIYWVRLVGRRSWLTTATLAVSVPVVVFFFFEIGMKILLPKGITEPLFYPLYQALL